jgi:hypothetical protein
MIAVRTAALAVIVMVGGVRQQLRREAFRADLDGEGGLACRHEPGRDERPDQQHRQQQPGQPPLPPGTLLGKCAGHNASLRPTRAYDIGASTPGPAAVMVAQAGGIASSRATWRLSAMLRPLRSPADDRR